MIQLDLFYQNPHIRKIISNESLRLQEKPKEKKKIPSPKKKEYKNRKKEKVESMFSFSKRSITLLNKVHPDLKSLSMLAIKKSVLDFAILSSTIRTVEQQRQFVKDGKSTTMNSRHLPNSMGQVCAIDIGVLINNRISWKTSLYPSVADAYQKAARELDINLVWGGCWQNINQDLDIDELQFKYIERKRREGKRPFMDLVHFELPWSEYP